MKIMDFIYSLFRLGNKKEKVTDFHNTKIGLFSEDLY